MPIKSGEIFEEIMEISCGRMVATGGYSSGRAFRQYWDEISFEVGGRSAANLFGIMVEKFTSKQSRKDFIWSLSYGLESKNTAWRIRSKGAGVILGTGTFCRDIFELLHNKKEFLIEAKPFCLGRKG